MARMANAMELIGAKYELGLHTRQRQQISNEVNSDPIPWGELQRSEAYKRTHSLAFHRDTLPSRKYNCHGLSFASRRTNIHYAEEILKIIKDDEYTQISLVSVEPGDIAVYFNEQNGDVEHSGVVIRVDSIETLRIPAILSKWGLCHEVIHQVSDCPYRAQDVRYFRIKA